MVAEDVILVGTVALRHTFPERNGLLRIVACHGSKDKSHIVGLCLIVSRILQVAEREILSSHGTRQIAYTAAYSLIEHIAQDVGTYLLVLLLGKLLGTVLCHSMSNFMSQDDGKSRLILCIGQQAFIHHNFSTRHTEGVGTLVLHEIEFPCIVFHIVGKTVLLQIGFHGCSQFAPYPLHHGRMLSIGRLLGSRHILSIFLVGEAEHLLV